MISLQFTVYGLQMITKRLQIGVFSFLFPLSTFLLYSSTANAQRMTESLHKLQYAEMVINSLYVDSVDEVKLVEDGIRGMLSKLDPHSSYSTPKEVKELKEPLDGNFEGIGVQFNMMEDTLIVIQPVSNGPSERVGIIAGDRIISVNDTAIAGVKMSKEEIMKRLRGEGGAGCSAFWHRRDTQVYRCPRQDSCPFHRCHLYDSSRHRLYPHRQFQRDDASGVH